ncbi:MAG: hypothetical protein WB502_03940 [Thermoactinomyces sp.]
MSKQNAVPHCPFCESVDVELYSIFGTAQLVRQYYCNSCRSVFEFIRWQEKLVEQEKAYSR